MSNLRLISQTTISTGANKISITDVFSADYEIYCIQFFKTSAGTQRENNSFDMRLINSSGQEIADSVYHSKMLMYRGVSGNPIEVGSENRDDFGIFYHDTIANDGVSNCTMWIFNPFASDRFTYQVQQTSGMMAYTGTTKIPSFTKGLAVLNQQSSITGYSFTNRDSYTIATGTFKTFGLRIDQ